MQSHDTILHWFPTSIYSKKMNLDKINQYLISKALTLQNWYKESNTAWRCPTFSTLNSYDWRTDNDEIIHKLIKECSQEVHKFACTYGVDKSVEELICNDFWFNIAQPGEYQEYHQHPNSHFSLTYYLQALENCGNIVFKNLQAMFDMYPLPIQNKSLNQLSYSTAAYTPEESMLIIFRSHIPHMVEQNLSNKPRIGITMNFSYTR